MKRLPVFLISIVYLGSQYSVFGTVLSKFYCDGRSETSRPMTVPLSKGKIALIMPAKEFSENPSALASSINLHIDKKQKQTISFSIFSGNKQTAAEKIGKEEIHGLLGSSQKLTEVQAKECFDYINKTFLSSMEKKSFPFVINAIEKISHTSPEHLELLAQLYYVHGAYNLSHQTFKRAFRNGSVVNPARAWRSLGFLYYSGLGVKERSLEKSIDYWSKAAKANDKCSEYMLFFTQKILRKKIDFIKKTTKEDCLLNTVNRSLKNSERRCRESPEGRFYEEQKKVKECLKKDSPIPSQLAESFEGVDFALQGEIEKYSDRSIVLVNNEIEMLILGSDIIASLDQLYRQGYVSEKSWIEGLQNYRALFIADNEALKKLKWFLYAQFCYETEDFKNAQESFKRAIQYGWQDKEEYLEVIRERLTPKQGVAREKECSLEKKSMRFSRQYPVSCKVEELKPTLQKETQKVEPLVRNKKRKHAQKEPLESEDYFSNQKDCNKFAELEIIFAHQKAKLQYESCIKDPKKRSKKLNEILKHLAWESAYSLTGPGKPETLQNMSQEINGCVYNSFFSRRLNQKDRLVYAPAGPGRIVVLSCQGHYDD